MTEKNSDKGFWNIYSCVTPHRPISELDVEIHKAQNGNFVPDPPVCPVEQGRGGAANVPPSVARCAPLPLTLAFLPVVLTLAFLPVVSTADRRKQPTVGCCA